MAGYYILRQAYPVDTSALDNGAIISSATFKVKSDAATGVTGDNDAQAYVSVIQANMASDTVLATSDYNDFGFTKGSDDITCANIVTNKGNYHSWTLNSTGLGWINRTGYTKLGLLEGHDIENSAIGGRNSIGGYYSETAGTGSDPYLEITYTAIAYDAVSSTDATASGTTITWSHTCTGSDLVLLVGINGEAAAGFASGVTYNGVALTKQNAVTVTNASSQSNELWYLKGPATGANNIVVTFATSNKFASCRGVSYSGVVGGVDTTAGTYNNDNQAQSGNSLATSVTTATDKCWTALISRSDGTMTAGSGTTFRSSGAFGFFDSGGTVTPAGTSTLTVNKTSATYHSHIMVSLLPTTASAPTGHTKNMLLLGVA